MKTEDISYEFSVDTKKKPKIGLLPRIVIAIILAIVLGLFLPDWFARIFQTFNGLFSQFLGFLIPLIIVGLITPAIGELGRGAGKWVGVTALLAYVSTLFAGFLALAVCWFVLPRMLAGVDVGPLENPEESNLSAYFSIEIPPMFDIMTALVLSFCIGIGLTFIRKGTLQKASVEFRTIIVRIIEKVIIPLLPVYIFGMFLALTMNGQIWTIVGTFAGVIVLVFGLTVVTLIIQFLFGGWAIHKNPFKMLWNMMPAYITALGTSSSAATIPVTLECTLKNGIPGPIASFVVPLCATIHLAGSTLKITSFAMAILIITGQGLDLWQLVGFIFMLGVIMIAAPGVPGGAIMAAVGILQSMLGFDEVAVGLMIASYIAIDSFGTATNVTGDGALAAIMARWTKGKEIDFGEQLSEEAKA